MVKTLLTFLGAIGAIMLFAVLLKAQGLPESSGLPREIKPASHHDTSPELRHVKPSPRPVRPPREIPLRRHRQPTQRPLSPDPVLQSSVGIAVGTTPGLGFDGVGLGNGNYVVNAAPPDPNGAPGARVTLPDGTTIDQYVQWVNDDFAVFDKGTGSVLSGPMPGNTLWNGFGGPCESNNDGDPIVQYDARANRWVLAQFAATGGPPFYYCVAISTSPDATGSYHRYAFQYANFNDYAKISVWPDAYYVSFNMFQGDTFIGSQVCAYDRNAMLNGIPATQQCFQLSSAYGGLLPSDLDGPILPPAGSPNFFLASDSNVLQLWKFHVDWTNPSLSTLTGPSTIPVAAFTLACGNGGVCIPQSETSQLLDSLGDRLMYRLAYRNFPDGHESLVVNHSVNAGGNRTGVRWYELRNPQGNTMASGLPVLYQQGTYSPNTTSRWMGSIAMDKIGNIAVGYSVSSSGIHPGIRYTGRAPSDPLGLMGVETSMIEGTGSQTATLDRWGDYTSMRIDPTDDCTFWYTNEYLKSNGTFNWSTRIASFKFTTCQGGAQDGNPSAPTNTVATAISTSQVQVIWGPSTGGADHYEVWRSFNASPYVLIGSSTTSSFIDGGLSSATTYLYRIRAISSGGNASSFSNTDLATTVLFSDDPLIAGFTIIKGQHFVELRQAVDAVRISAGLPPVSWTNPGLIGLPVQATHVQELRTNLNQALAALGFGAVSYTDPTLITGSTVIKKMHVEELRRAVK